VVSRESDAVRVDYGHSAPATSFVGQVPNAYDVEGGESSFSLSYPAGAGYGEPYSPTHALVVRTNGDTRTVGVDGAARDITILLPVARSREPAISVLTSAPSAAVAEGRDVRGRRIGLDERRQDRAGAERREGVVGVVGPARSIPAHRLRHRRAQLPRRIQRGDIGERRGGGPLPGCTRGARL